jgi:hypothetical protein
MTVTEVMIDLRDRGIQLEAHGDRLRYSPKEAMTLELAERVNTHKPVLLAILTANDVSAAVLWQAALDLLEGDPDFPTAILADYRRASVHWEFERTVGDHASGLSGGAIDHDAQQCDKCGSTDFRDTLVHEGCSARRDCAQCGRFIDFPRWYENDGTGSPQASVTTDRRLRSPLLNNASGGQPESENRAGQIDQ